MFDLVSYPMNTNGFKVLVNPMLLCAIQYKINIQTKIMNLIKRVIKREIFASNQWMWTLYLYFIYKKGNICLFKYPINININIHINILIIETLLISIVGEATKDPISKFENRTFLRIGSFANWIFLKLDLLNIGPFDFGPFVIGCFDIGSFNFVSFVATSP